MTGAHETRFDFEPSGAVVSREAETIDLRREVGRLAAALFPNRGRDIDSALQARLLAFAEG